MSFYKIGLFAKRSSGNSQEPSINAELVSGTHPNFFLTLIQYFPKIEIILGCGEKPFFSKVLSLSPYIVLTHKN